MARRGRGTSRTTELAACNASPTVTRAFGATVEAVAVWIRKTESYPETLPQLQLSQPRATAMATMPMPTGRHTMVVNWPLAFCLNGMVLA
ncbi:hypothetical protein BC629DRAFT_210262 [Irpex lacteus]|nr:hypothetical protein BC629DRAFT_210262 [Irpex lacteus]